MRLSVIVSTYNSPEWLEKAIWGYAVQSHQDFELLIADDGSTVATRLLIEQLARKTGIAIRHIWHADDGFRKCVILNRAIAAASADYLVFSDGDCIPRRDFLACHAAMARPGHLLSGGYVRLPMALSRFISVENVVRGEATRLAWLRSHGLNLSLKTIRLGIGPFWARHLDRLTPTKATWNGSNASGWKSDVVQVNGHDERMGWGGEDRELGERMINAGIRPVQIRHRAILVHLDHARGYVRSEVVEYNRRIRKQTRRSRAIWTPYGIRKDSGIVPLSDGARSA